MTPAMTKIEQPIPGEIMEQARDVADRLFRRGQYRDWHVAKDPERIIALALQDAANAAEKRGEERERERCARIVDEIGSALMDRTPAEAAKAIRGS